MRKIAASVSFILFIGWMASLYAGVNKWTKLPNPRGGKVFTFTSIPLSWGTEFFAGTTDNGVYGSTDGGETWLPVCSGKPKHWIENIKYQITPKKTTIYIGSWGEGVFKTTDFGSTCKEINNGLPVKDLTSLTIVPNGNLFVTLYGEGVYTSDDGGENWNALNNGLTNKANYSVALDPEGNLYTTAWGTGVFKMPPGSSEWQLFSAGLPNLNVHRIFVVNEQGVANIYVGLFQGGLSKLVNGVWESANAGLPSDKLFPMAIEKDGAGNIYLLLWEGGFYTKPEGGETWSRVPVDETLPQNILGLGVGDQKEWLMATYGTGVYRCDQGAQNCKQIFFLNDLITIDLFVSSEEKIFLGTDGGAFQWDGQRWIPTARKEGEVGAGYVNHISQFGQDLFMTSWNFVHRSEDEGLTWERSTKGLEERYQIRIHPCHLGTQDLLFATTDNGIFKSDDGGENWREASTGLTQKNMWEIVCIPTPTSDENPSSSGVVIAANENNTGVLFYSKDFGETWQEVKNDLAVQRPRTFGCNPSGLVCYAGTIGGFVYKTTDGGASWQQCAPMEVSALNRDMIMDGEEIFIGTDEGYVFHSTDGCQSWTALGVVLPTDMAWALALEKKKGNRTVWAGTAGEGNFRYSFQTCGNEKKEFEETCDDGNQEAGDGCTELCQIEDGDGDGIANHQDNCPQFFCLDQTDSDQDGQGDVCDDDDDGDGLLDSADNCINVVNEDQLDIDGDGSGDLCDDDRDGDEAVDEIDNCKLVQNSDQLDTDNDGQGDVCDEDKDGDGYLDAEDNCPLAVNADQLDNDQDKLGDVCDETPQPVVDEGGDELAFLEGEAVEKTLPTPPNPEFGGLPMPNPSKESTGGGSTSSEDDSTSGGGGGGAAGCQLILKKR